MDNDNSLGPIILKLIAERDLLQSKHAYDQSAIQELQRQNRQLSLLLAQAQFSLQKKDLDDKTTKRKTINLAPSSQKAPSKEEVVRDWIGGTWLSHPDGPLAPIEVAWIKKSAQAALALLSILQASPEYPLQPLSLRVNTSLLFSAILRSSSSLQSATSYAEEALNLALENSLDHNLVGKARFHRGLCYLYAERWADASWSFYLAHGTEGHEEMVKKHWQVAEKRRRECELGEEGRVISKDFV